MFFFVFAFGLATKNSLSIITFSFYFSFPICSHYVDVEAAVALVGASAADDSVTPPVRSRVRRVLNFDNVPDCIDEHRSGCDNGHASTNPPRKRALPYRIVDG